MNYYFSIEVDASEVIMSVLLDWHEPCLLQLCYDVAILVLLRFYAHWISFASSLINFLERRINKVISHKLNDFNQKPMHFLNLLQNRHQTYCLALYKYPYLFYQHLHCLTKIQILLIVFLSLFPMWYSAEVIIE